MKNQTLYVIFASSFFSSDATTLVLSNYLSVFGVERVTIYHPQPKIPNQELDKSSRQSAHSMHLLKHHISNLHPWTSSLQQMLKPSYLFTKSFSASLNETTIGQVRSSFYQSSLLVLNNSSDISSRFRN